MATLIDEATLDHMFKDARGEKYLKQSGRCHCCGSDVEITIEKTLVGYGFKGGMLYESDTSEILIRCEHCFSNIADVNKSDDVQ